MRASVKQDHASRECANAARVGLTARQCDALAFIKRYLLIIERGHIRRNPGVPAWEGRAIELLDPLPTIGPSLNGEPLRFVSFRERH